MLLQLLQLLIGVSLTEEAMLCASCATSNLKDNWPVTGLPSRPSEDFVFTDECGTIDPIPWTTSTCSSSCFELITVLGGSYAVLRGCHEDFLEQASHAVVVTTPTDNYCEINPTNETVMIKEMADEGRAGISFCFTQSEATPDETEACNTKFKSNARPRLTPPCVSVAKKECYACSKYDGKGSCGNEPKGTCSGFYCTKTRGKINGKYLEERGCAGFNPLKKDDFCSWSEQTYDLRTGSGSVQAPSRSKRDVSLSYRADQCFCSSDKCNAVGSPQRWQWLGVLPLLWLRLF